MPPWPFPNLRPPNMSQSLAKLLAQGLAWLISQLAPHFDTGYGGDSPTWLTWYFSACSKRVLVFLISIDPTAASLVLFHLCSKRAFIFSLPQKECRTFISQSRRRMGLPLVLQLHGHASDDQGVCFAEPTTPSHITRWAT